MSDAFHVELALRSTTVHPPYKSSGKCQGPQLLPAIVDWVNVFDCRLLYFAAEALFLVKMNIKLHMNMPSLTPGSDYENERQ